MSGQDLAITRREEQMLATTEGMARFFWRRYYRTLRLFLRAEAAQIDHDIMCGTGDPTKMPVGILHASQRVAR